MLKYTALYASLLVVWLIFLTAYVIRLRLKYRVGLLHKDHPKLLKAIRIHGNATEYVPMGLILLACAESLHIGVIWLHITGSFLLAGRILHFWGLRKTGGVSIQRTAGMLLTFTAMLLLAALNLMAY